MLTVICADERVADSVIDVHSHHMAGVCNVRIFFLGSVQK